MTEIKKRKKREYARRTPAERARDREIIVRLFMLNIPISDIPKMLKAETGADYELSPQHAYKEIRVVKKQWQDRLMDKIDDYKASELVILDWLTQQYMEAWQRSKARRVTETVRLKNKKASGRGVKEQIVKRQFSNGDPEYLKGIERIIKIRMELFGVKDGSVKNFYQFNLDIPPEMKKMVEENKPKAIKMSTGATITYVPEELENIDETEVVGIIDDDDENDNSDGGED